METKINYSQDEISRMELRSFVKEGLPDAYNNQLLNFDSTFNELEERYSANE